MYVPSLFFLEKALAALIDHAIAGPYSGPLDGVFVGLSQFPTPMLTPNQGLAQITEADYTGYARLPLTWLGPYQNPLGNYAIQADGAYFTPTDSVTPNQIVGMFVADALTAGNLLFSEPLPGGPIFLEGPANAFSLSVIFQLATGSNYGDVIVVQ